MLEFTNFKKYYHNIPVLDIPSFTIRKGIHLLKGSNGSGKTLFRSLAGLQKFDGEIKLDNISLKNSPLIQRRFINYSDAEPKFPPFLTGMDFIRLFALLKQFSAGETNEIIERLKISAYSNNPIGTYSSGMLKMILRNLPMRSTVYIVYVFTYFLMILPELIVLGTYPLSPQYNIVFVALFGISILLFLHIITYSSSLGMNLFFRNSLIFFIVILFALLFRVPVIMLIAMNFIVSYILFYTQYFDYEIKTRT